MISQLLIFVLVVGIGSTVVLDLWGVLSGRLGWLSGTHWPSVGRWILGLPAGRLVFDGADGRPFTALETATGWVFHYGVGLAYAAMLPLFWGTGFLQSPTVLPVFLIGVVASTLAGLVILMPGMGGGVFARKLPNAAAKNLYVLVTHIIFAVAQYLLALSLA